MKKNITSRLMFRPRPIRWALLFLLCVFLFVPTNGVFAQFLDQGAIAGTVQDDTGAIIPGAVVELESPDTGFKRTTKADQSGAYIFSPIKIGKYTITASAPGFENAVQENISLSQGQRLEVSPKLKPGSVGESVTVTDAPPLLQSQDSSVGQAMNSPQINDTPLNGRNAVYLAQLSAGAAPANGSRGAASGDFDANGMRPEQNNFVLDGVDNNAQSVDVLGGTSYSVNPPPDALAEFKVSTSNYSAEFGHSAGAVVAASVKAGTNQIHGDLWEYWRNDILDTHDWTTPTLPTGEYRQNQFGATLGGPVLKDKLFLFGDAQATRIVINLAQAPISVPTPLERQGNFTELLNPRFTGGSQPQVLYQPHNNQTHLTCNGLQNVLCPNQIDPLAQKLLNMYPLPNTNNGLGYNNYSYTLKQPSNTFQWDTRMDWNISSKDQAFARFSYLNARSTFPAPLGPILDGSCSGSTCVSGTRNNYANNFVLSETHIFNPRLVNELRFAYNYAHFGLVQLNSNVDLSSTLGLGSVPFGPDSPNNGGLPNVTIGGGGGISNFGTRGYRPEQERQNVYQALDNVSWTLGNHSVRLGFSYQSIRSYTLEPPASRPQYTYDGTQTGSPGVANTGSGIADFLTNNMSTGSIGPFAASNDAQDYISGYIQDDWRAAKNLTFNLGVRYDHFQPYKEMAGRQANFYPTSVGIGTGAGVYRLPAQNQGKIPLNPAFLAVLAKDNISLAYDSNPRLSQSQNLNFAPRLGFAYTADPKAVFRGGFGLFYQGQQAVGAAGNLGFNYPFVFTDNFPAPSCTVGSNNCANNGYTLENGFADVIAQGLTTHFAIPGLVGQSPNLKTTYAMDYNLTFEEAITNNLVATIGYVGTAGRHLAANENKNAPAALVPSIGNTQAFQPFPDFGASTNILNAGISKYNGLQVKLQKRMTHGVSFLSTYTWSHAMDDATEALGFGLGGYRDPNLIPIRDEFTNSGWDTRHRVTFTGTYVIPFGRGGSNLSHDSRIVDALLGGWSTNATYQLQSGQPFSVSSANQINVSGVGLYAVRVGNPFAAGGTPDPSNPSITCPTSVRNKAHWFNPCAFRNPLPASLLTPFAKNNGNPYVPAPGYVYPTYITDTATAKLFTGGVSNSVYGPGFQRLDMSLFKHFQTFEDQYLELRVDGFNMLNTPAYGTPNGSIGQTGGLISSARLVQLNTPNGRFFQLSAKYVF